MASSEWGPTTELLTCIIFSGCLSGFLCDKVKVYSDVSEEHTTYPHFLGGKTSLGACYCNMEEGMVYTAWVGGFWKNQEFRMEGKDRACTKPQAISTYSSQGERLILTSKLPM